MVQDSQTVPKPVSRTLKSMVQFSVPSQKKVIQYSNKAKNCHKSEKDGTILKQSQNLSAVRKRWYNTETVPKPANSQKRWYNTQSMSKPVTSQKKMVKYSTGPKPVNSQKNNMRSPTCHKSKNIAKNLVLTKPCHQSKKDSTILRH